MRIAWILTAALLAAPAFAQGHDGHGDAHAGHDMGHMDDLSRFGEPGDPAGAARTITVHASEIAYDVVTLNAKAGETITFKLINDGTQDHEFGVGDAAFFEAHARMVEAMPGMAHATPNIVTAKPGETANLTWTFTKAGAFQFACSMPGHAALGMAGEILVK